MRAGLVTLLAAILVAGCLEEPGGGAADAGLQAPTLPTAVPTLPTVPSLVPPTTPTSEPTPPTEATPTPTTPSPAPPPSPTPPTPSPTPPSPSPPPEEKGPNALANGGFEDGVKGWTVVGAHLDCAVAASGSCSLALPHGETMASATVDVPRGDARFATVQYSTRDPAERHRGHAWLTVTMYALAPNGRVVWDSRMVWDDAEPYSTWRTEGLAIAVPEEAATVRLRIEAGPSTAGPTEDLSWVDDVTLVLSPLTGTRLANGGFEEGSGVAPQSWGFQQGSERDCSVARTGSCSLRLQGVTPISGQGFAPEGKALQLEVWAKAAQPGATLRLNLTAFTPSGLQAAHASESFKDVGADWTLLAFPSKPLAIPADADKVSLFVMLEDPSGGASTWWLDDVSARWS